MEPVCECGHYYSTHRSSVHRQASRCQGNGCMCMQFKAPNNDQSQYFESNIHFSPLVPELAEPDEEEELDGDVDTTWVLFLVTLNLYTASFSHPSHNTTMTLSRDEWEKLGRPTTLYTTPTTVNPLDA